MDGSSVLPLSSQFILCEFGSLGENMSLPRPPHSHPLPWQDTQVVPSIDLHQSVHIFPTDSHPQTAAPNQAVACGRGGLRTRLKTLSAQHFTSQQTSRGVCYHLGEQCSSRAGPASPYFSTLQSRPWGAK